MMIKVVVYVVTQDSNGGHEPDGLMSVWSDRDSAETERVRLCARAHYDNSSFHVIEVELDTPSDETLA